MSKDDFGPFKGEQELYERRYACRIETIVTEWKHFSQMGANHKCGLMSFTAYKDMRFKQFDEIDKKADRDFRWN